MVDFALDYHIWGNVSLNDVPSFKHDRHIRFGWHKSHTKDCWRTVSMCFAIMVQKYPNMLSYCGKFMPIVSREACMLSPAHTIHPISSVIPHVEFSTSEQAFGPHILCSAGVDGDRYKHNQARTWRRLQLHQLHIIVTTGLYDLPVPFRNNKHAIEDFLVSCS